MYKYNTVRACMCRIVCVRIRIICDDGALEYDKRVTETRVCVRTQNIGQHVDDRPATDAEPAPQSGA